MTSSLSHVLQTLLDRGATASTRVEAARLLAACNDAVVVDALLRVVAEEEASEALAQAAGEGLAEVLLRRGEVDRAPLWDFTGPAYVAFDDAVARHLRAHKD